MYGMLCFIAPSVASTLDKVIGIPGLSDTIRWKKSQIDESITNVSSISEFTSGAMDAKDSIINGVEVTKEKIDTVRQWAQKIEETYEDTKETIEDVKTIYNEAQTQIGEVKQVVDTISQMTGTGK